MAAHSNSESKTFNNRQQRDNYIFYLNGCAIEKVNSICDIGVLIQSDLKCITHCNIKRVVLGIFLTYSKGMIVFYTNLPEIKS